MVTMEELDSLDLTASFARQESRTSCGATAPFPLTMAEGNPASKLGYLRQVERACS